MCGIVGVISKGALGLSLQEFNVFDELLYHDTVRGSDATGVITVEKDTGFHINKEACPGHEFLEYWSDTKAFKNRAKDAMALIGHNRKATMGDKRADSSAHPFVAENRFAMVHNGTLYAHKDLADVDVDSHALTIALDREINKEGATSDKDAVSTVLSDVYGAYACVWYNQVSNRINIVRNSDRPLSIIETSWAYYFASELRMLTWVLDRNNIKIEKDKIFPVTVDTLYTFDMNPPRQPMKQEGLSLKKATSPTSTTPTLHTGFGSSSGGASELSKNQFKNLRKYWLGKDMNFGVDSYCDQGFPVGDGINYLGSGPSMVLGSHIKHTVRSKLNMDELEMMNPDAMLHSTFSGVVDRVEYNKTTREIIFHINKCKRSLAV